MPATRPYRWLAQYYEQIFADFRLPLDAARTKLIGPILPRIHSACDLACGTGTTALDFARRGLETYGVDLSPAMCTIARTRARKAGLPVRVIRADMRDFHLPTPVDLVTSEYDSINHLSAPEHFTEVAQAAARALNPGGYFFFDVNNSLAFERHWNGTVWIEKPHLVLVMLNSHNEDRTRAWSDLEWFVQQGRLWRRHKERVEQVCWTQAEIRVALSNAGFKSVRAWDAAPFWVGHFNIGRGARTIYLAKR